MRIYRYLLLITLLLPLANTPAICTVETKVDLHPSISWSGGKIAFERDSAIMIYSGKKRRLISITASPYKQPGEKIAKIIGTPPFENGQMPAISPDSSKVAWAHSYGYSNSYMVLTQLVGEYSADFQNVYVTDLRTTKSRRLTVGGGTLPFWSPDGRWVGYVTMKGALEAVNIQSGRRKRLASKVANTHQLSWLRFGPAVALEKNNSVAWYAIDRSGKLKRQTPLLRLPAKSDPNKLISSWTLSRDGKKSLCLEASLYPNPQTYKDIRILLIDAQGSHLLASLNGEQFNTVVSTASEWLLRCTISGDGKKYALAIQGSIWKGDVSKGRPTQLTGVMYNAAQ